MIKIVLKYEGCYMNDSEYKHMFTIEKQSERMNKTYLKRNEDGVQVVSSCYPDIVHDPGAGLTVYLRGDTVGRDNNGLRMRNNEVKRIFKALNSCAILRTILTER